MVAKELDVSQRHIQRLYAKYKKTGTIHSQGMPGRPIRPISVEETEAVLNVYDRDPVGVLHTVKNLGNHIIHRRVYHIMKSSGTWTPTLFDRELLSLNIGRLNSRPYRPQTNGKLERFHKSLEDEIWHYSNLDDYV